MPSQRRKTSLTSSGCRCNFAREAIFKHPVSKTLMTTVSATDLRRHVLWTTVFFFRMAVIMVFSAEQYVGTAWTRQRGELTGYVSVRRRKCWVHSLLILIIMEHFGILFVCSHSQWFLLWRTWVRNIFLVKQVCSFHSSVCSCAWYAHVRNCG